MCIGRLVLSQTHHFMAVGSEERERGEERWDVEKEGDKSGLVSRNPL